MNYNLNQSSDKTEQKASNLASLRKLIALIGEERRNLIVAFGAIFLNAGLSLLGPYLIGYTIDTYIQAKQFHGVLVFSGILLALYSSIYSELCSDAHDGGNRTKNVIQFAQRGV
jgi:ATP-binding cassette subfamily B protein